MTLAFATNFLFTSLLLLLAGTSTNANEDTNRAVRCFFQNAGGCNNIDGSCRRFCVDEGCNLAQGDFCSGLGFPPGRRELYINDSEEEEEEAHTVVDPHGIDFNTTHLNITPECLSADYDLSLVITEGHLYVMAVPTSSDSSLNCPSLVTSTVYGNGGELSSFRPTKQLASIGPELVATAQQNALWVGGFQLSTLKEAFTRAIVSTSDHDDYDMMENNCSVFVMSILNHLGLVVSDEIRSFVVTGLMESESMMTIMREAMEQQQTGTTVSSGGGLRGRALRLLSQMVVSDQKMVETVVDHNIEHFDACCTA